MENAAKTAKMGIIEIFDPELAMHLGEHELRPVLRRQAGLLQILGYEDTAELWEAFGGYADFEYSIRGWREIEVEGAG